MGNRDIIYKMAFSFLKKISADFLRELDSREVSPEEFFNLSTKELVNKLALHHNHEFDKLKREEAVALAEKEWNKIKNHNIQPLFLLDDNYPQRLAETNEPPIILYKLGEADLDSEQTVAIVGTRKPTPYGIDFCNKIVDELGTYFPDISIVSGLAYGVDATSHKKALEKNLPTIAVVAHGLNMIYPAAHRNLAKEIIHKGGAIISEYPFNTQPYKPNFLARNRIIAGLSCATIVAESSIKGGAMSTANFAFLYNREVMALPGRSSDELSSGCNLLIRKNKAHLIEGAADFVEIMGWKPLNLPIETQQRNLFPELQGDTKKIYEKLQSSREPVQLDQLCYQTGLNPSKLLVILGELEFDGIIIRHPGNRYSIS